jgi:hypothetical protein
MSRRPAFTMAGRMFDESTSTQPQDSGFSPVSQGVQQAAQQELERRRQMQQQQSDQRKNMIGTGTGIVGAILGGVFGGLPGATAGYSAGKALGTGKMPDMGAMQSLLAPAAPQDNPFQSVAAWAPRPVSTALPKMPQQASGLSLGNL